MNQSNINNDINNLISIIIPVYNSELYISRCLDSVLNQTYNNLDIIIIDDGSSDSSISICKKYKKIDNRIRIFHQKNSGQASARNKGISVANGSFLAFVDSDDWIDKNMIKEMYELLLMNEADITVCQFVETDSHFVLNSNNKATIECLENKESLSRLFDGWWGNFSCNKIFKRELFENILYPIGQYFEEIPIMYRIFLKANRIVFTNKKYYYYYQHEASTTNNITVQKMKDLSNGFDVLLDDKRIIFCYKKIHQWILNILVFNKKQLLKCNKVDKECVKYINKLVRNYCKIKDLSLRDYIRSRVLLYFPKLLS